MPWEEVSRGRFERPLDTFETTLKLVGDLFAGFNREHWALNVIARVQFLQVPKPQIVSLLSRSWILLRYHHPFVAASAEGNKLVYKTPSQDDLDKWVGETFFVHQGQTTAEFLDGATAAVYGSLHYFPDSSQIILRLHHWQVDGIGSMHLLDRLLTYFASTDATMPTFGEEWKSLSRSHTEVAPLPAKESGSAEEAHKLAMQHPANSLSVGLKMIPDLPGGTKRATAILDSAYLRNIAAACKHAGVSVTSAVHAAIVCSTQELAAPATADRNFVTLGLFNHRAHVKEPYNDSTKWPMGCRILGLPFSLPRGDWASHAQALQQIYRQPISVQDCPILQYYNRYSDDVNKVFSEPPSEEALKNLPSQPLLSSLGVIDGRVQHSYGREQKVSVEYVELVLDSMTTQPTLFLWSWREKLMLSVCYNTSYYEKSFIDQFLTETRQTLDKGLGIESGTWSII